jgi:hypothetical protein
MAPVMWGTREAKTDIWINPIRGQKMYEFFHLLKMATIPVNERLSKIITLEMEENI